MQRQVGMAVRWGRTVALALLASVIVQGCSSAAQAAQQADLPSTTVVLAGGCYWGVQSVFRHVRGIIADTAGYAVPGHGEPAEAVRLVYDSTRISYRQVLDIFFSVVHDPTEVDRQGPDVGAEYRSVVFAGNASQQSIARAYIDSLGASHRYSRPIATEITGLHAFRVVGPDQQDYAEKNSTDAYIVTNDVPKVAALRRQFPALYKD
ncbi:MAG: peptide-methionine (S)-S-oxide reductase [Gemmatimonadales bacterium]